MSERLSPCPFCGNTDVTLMTRRGKDGWRDRFYVLCGYDDGGCGASGEWTHYTDEAVSAWNRRATGKRDAKGAMPAVDAAEVVHGRWDEIRDYSQAGLISFECSECGRLCDTLYKYCPNCGAKMDGERRTNDGKAD